MTTHYADSIDGLDTNPGTQALPFATYAKLVSAMQNGDVGLLKKDRHYDIVTGFSPTISQKNNITLGSYGTGGLPVIDAMTYENSNATGWVSEGDGVFSKALGNGTANVVVRRVFVGASNTGKLRSQRSIGTAMRRAKKATASTLASIKANLNADDIWWQADSTLGNKLYIFTEAGNTTVPPPAFYNGLAIHVRDFDTVGAPNTVLLRQVNGALIQDIEGWGNDGSAFIAQSEVGDAVPTTNIIFRNCVARYVFIGGFKAAPFADNDLAPRVEISNVLVQGCTVDMNTSPQEQEPSTVDYGYLTNVTDAIAFLDNATNCRAEDCMVINSMHVAYTMGVYNDNRTLTDRCGFIRCKVKFDPWHFYGRASTIYRCSSSCFLMYCDFDGQSICSQINGAAYVYRNVWRNMKVSASKANVSHAIAITAELIYRANMAALGDDAYIRNFPTGVRFIENIFENPIGPIIRMTAFSYPNFDPPDPVIPDNTVEFANNICLHQGGTFPWFEEEIGGSTVGTQKLQNNSIFTGAGNPPAVVRIRNVNTTTNGGPGCYDNITEDPLVDVSVPGKVTMSPASPCLRAGKFMAAPIDMGLYTRPAIGPFSDSSVFNYS